MRCWRGVSPVLSGTASGISVIDHGRVIAEGTSDELKAQVGGHRVVVTLVEAADAATAREVLRRLGSGEPSLSDNGRELDIAVEDGPQALQHVLAELGSRGVRIHDAGMRRPTLDDVFLTLTGHRAAAETEESAQPQEATR